MSQAEDTHQVDFNFRREGEVVLAFVVIVYTIVLVKNAWIGDDAYITFRTIENFLSGYGLVYNIGERVQTFTHPLWMFLNSGIYFLVSRLLGINFWAQLYYQVIGISIFLSIVTAGLLAFKVSRTILSGVLAVAVLTMSKAFVDYSTSGLENPLSHLILVVFFVVYFRKTDFDPRKIFWLSLLAALATLNRPDMLLLYLPALVYAFWKLRDKRRGVVRVFLGFTPLIVWELFSLLYYGFLSPNTAYAKLNTGISSGLMLKQGYYYYLNSISLDPLTLSVILVVFVLTFILRKWRNLPFLAGIMLYFVYVLSIGGDFMSGRYFAAPLLICAALMAVIRFQDIKAFGLTLLIVILLGYSSPRPPILFTTDYTEAYGEVSEVIDERGIADEHLFYHSRLGLLADNRYESYPSSRFAGRKWVQRIDRPPIETTGPMGVFGYVKGPNVHVIDLNGLADPLMARLPVEDPDQWRIGHFRHLIPEGYLETKLKGDVQLENEAISQYYEKLRLITQGNLFNAERLETIVRFNLGQYDHFVQSYLKSLKAD